MVVGAHVLEKHNLFKGKRHVSIALASLGWAAYVRAAGALLRRLTGESSVVTYA
jgi:hypothetical protein